MSPYPESIPKGNERILLVDDNESIANVIGIMLQKFGYKVTTFGDSREAVKVFSEKPSEFDLVITDYKMPYLNGKEVAEKMIRIRSDIPIILCTAYPDLVSSESARPMGFRGFILKPFGYQELAKLVRRVLDQKEPGDITTSEIYTSPKSPIKGA